MKNLLRLFQIEWLKNMSYKPVIVFLSIYFLFLLSFALICNQSIPFFGISIEIKEFNLLEFPQTWNFIFYIGALFKLFLGMVIMLTVTNEMSQKLVKQNIIDGLSRSEYILSKVITIVSLSFISTAILFLVGLYFGMNDSNNVVLKDVTKELYFSFGYFLKLVNYLLLFFLIATLFRKGLIVLLVIFLLWVLEIVLRVVEFKFFSDQTDPSGFFFTDYLPLLNMSNLVDSPFERLQITQSLTNNTYVFEVPYSHIVVSFFYCFLCLFWIKNVLDKRNF